MQHTSLILLLLPLSTMAQAPGPYPYQISKAGQAHWFRAPNAEGMPTLYVTLQFSVHHSADGKLANDVAKDEIVVTEDGQRVRQLEIHQPRAADPLTVVMVLDTSGSMNEARKLDEAKRAARLFLDTLSMQNQCGLVLFNHQLRTSTAPGDREANRQTLRQQIDAAPANGGTAYLDAASRAVNLVRDAPGRKAVLLLTDGIDLNSRARLDSLIREAKDARVPIYTLGVGKPGRQEPIRTILVLDRSGSMEGLIRKDSRTSKMTALHRAASRFIEQMRPGARAALLPFSTSADPASPFSQSKAGLQQRIKQLKPEGETALFDAVFDAAATLEADPVNGKRAVIALTDGQDNASRRRVDEVIRRAKETGTPIHMLGLGSNDELDEPVLARLARETGGSYYQVNTEEKLIATFEQLAIRLHDDGFDEVALKRIAEETGGKFFHAGDARQLPDYYRGLAEELQSTYTVTFPSRRQFHDGTSRGIDISVVRGGLRLSGVAQFDYTVHGVVVPRLDRSVFLVLLLILVILLALPGRLRRVFGWSKQAA